MSAERDVNRIVRSWIREDEHDSADAILGIVLSRLDTTPQRRSWWSARRSDQMNNLVKAMLATAAVLAIAVVGYNLLPPGSDFGGRGTPAPTASTAPTPIPSVQELPAGGEQLQPGRYAWYWTGPPISFEVPAGWSSGNGTFIDKHTDQPNEVVWGVWLPGGSPVTAVYTDACHAEGALAPITRTVDGLAAALDAQASTDATVTDVSGEPAKRIDLEASAGLDRASCGDGSAGPLRIWADPGETNFYALAPGYRGFVHAVDVGGDLVVLAAAIGPEASTADIAELEAIVASLLFGP